MHACTYTCRPAKLSRYAFVSNWLSKCFIWSVSINTNMLWKMLLLQSYLSQCILIFAPLSKNANITQVIGHPVAKLIMAFEISVASDSILSLLECFDATLISVQEDNKSSWTILPDMFWLWCLLPLPSWLPFSSVLSAGLCVEQFFILCLKHSY